MIKALFNISVCRTALVALLAGMSLSACSDARRALGYDKSAPDEFAVMMRAPLSQPPDYSLRPPQPGAIRPQDGTPRDQARTVLLGRNSEEAFADRSAGERALLAQAGADEALPGIRRKVSEETTALIEADKSFTDKIMFWQDKGEPGVVIDAGKESRRLQENTALGRPVTEGDTPQIGRSKKAWLEGIF